MNTTAQTTQDIVEAARAYLIDLLDPDRDGGPIGVGAWYALHMATVFSADAGTSVIAKLGAGADVDHSGRLRDALLSVPIDSEIFPRAEVVFDKPGQYRMRNLHRTS